MSNKIRLWQVRLIHQSGYEAPHFFVEVEENQRENYFENSQKAIKEVSKMTRLSDFPEKWNMKAEKLNRVLVNGKWVKSKS